MFINTALYLSKGYQSYTPEKILKTVLQTSLLSKRDGFCKEIKFSTGLVNFEMHKDYHNAWPNINDLETLLKHVSLTLVSLQIVYDIFKVFLPAGAIWFDDWCTSEWNQSTEKTPECLTCLIIRLGVISIERI